MSDAWASLIRPVDAGANFAQSFQQGQATNRQNMARNAMAALAQNPNNPRALAALAQADPETAMAYQKQRIEAVKAQLGEHQDSILKGAELLRSAKQANPTATDDQVYAIAYQAAQQAQIPLTDVPPPGDPRVPGYMKGLMTIADGLKPQSSDNAHFITPQPGGGAAIYDPTTGQTKWIIQPNDGSQTTGAPAGAPADAANYLRAHPELAPHFDEKYGAGAAQKVLGGPTPQASGQFPGH